MQIVLPFLYDKSTQQTGRYEHKKVRQEITIIVDSNQRPAIQVGEGDRRRGLRRKFTNEDCERSISLSKRTIRIEA